MKFTDLSEESKERAREALRSSLGNSYLGNEEEAVLAGKAVSAAFIAMERYDGAPDVCGDKVPVTDSNGVECGRVGPDFHVGDSVGTLLVSVKIDTSELEAQVAKVNGLLGGIRPKRDNESISFDEAAKPLIKWLAENVHPHHTAVVTSTSAELLEGKCSFPTTEYLRD